MNVKFHENCEMNTGNSSSATSIVTARRKVISTSLSSLFTAEALLHSADFFNRQNFILIEDLVRPRLLNTQTHFTAVPY